VSSGIRLRAATMEDAELLLEWRNDPDTRMASHNTEVVKRDEHFQWLKDVLESTGVQLYIAESEQVPVGTVRAVFRNGVYELSWSVAANARGKGIGERVVGELVSRIDGPIRAEIRRDNRASIRVAEDAGMTYDREIDGVVHYSREPR